MSKHTPGPWDAGPFGADYVNRTGGKKRFAVYANAAEPGEKLVAEMHGSPQEANARLVAAAPELLERLKTHADSACLGWNNMFNAPGCACGPCLDRAAIAKAEGK